MLTAQQVKEMSIQMVVADDEWQRVRKSLIGGWADGRENVARLRAYLDASPDDPLRVRRVLNVLTGSVHRAGHTRGQAHTDQLRLEVRTKWRTMLGLDTSGLRGSI